MFGWSPEKVFLGLFNELIQGNFFILLSNEFCAWIEIPEQADAIFGINEDLPARLLFIARSVYDELENKFLAHFGCGCSVLSIASNFLGSRH
ncbi:hypothetical protein G9A89_010261 [Geosiphon pyriformis]|nr:hypothetical protein G9A89_010261 [Geosiphon pyriformis]